MSEDYGERIASALERIASALESLVSIAGECAGCAASSKAKRRSREERHDLDIRAIALLAMQDPDHINVSAIAAQLNIPRQTLQRLPMFASQVGKFRQAKASVRSPRRGVRNGRNGSVDGIVEDDD